MPITVWSYLDELEAEKEEINHAINEVLQSGQLILGPKVKNFEEKFAAYCGTKFGVGVNSGTDAIFLALRALGVGEGDEVITVPNTAVPTVSAIVSSGASPKFVDIDPKTYLMDVNQLEKVITSKTKCLLVVHLYGQCVDMDRIGELSERHGLKILEDCAQAHGATFKGQMAGSFSHVSAFSFYPTKILGGYGDGGMVLTSDEEYFQKLKRLRFYGMEGKYYSDEHGYNSRLDELHAAILLKKLNHLGDYLLARRKKAKFYNESLKDLGLGLPQIAPDNDHAFYVYVVKHTKRDRIIEELKKREIFCNISYPWPIHIMKGYKDLGYKEGDFPNTEKAAKEIFSLPMYPSLTKGNQIKVIEALKEVLKNLT